MEKNTLENVCVYYKDAGGLRFEKQEHIIPAFLGGKKCWIGEWFQIRQMNYFQELKNMCLWNRL